MEYGRIEGFDNHLIDVIDFEINPETSFWFKWNNGTEWIQVKPFTEWVLHYDENNKNLKLLIGHNFNFSGETDLIVYASVAGVELEVYNGKINL